MKITISGDDGMSLASSYNVYFILQFEKISNLCFELWLALQNFWERVTAGSWKADIIRHAGLFFKFILFWNESVWASTAHLCLFESGHRHGCRRPLSSQLLFNCGLCLWLDLFAGRTSVVGWGTEKWANQLWF